MQNSERRRVLEENIRPLLEPSSIETNVCVAAYVFGGYDVYIPYFVYSVLKSYPAYYCRIFTTSPVRSKVARSLDIVRSDVSDRFDIVQVKPSNLLGIPRGSPLSRAPKTKYAARWVLPRAMFADFDYVYMSDVDFLVVPEEPSLAKLHIAHIEAWGLPYSNAERPGKRLTGLHFFKVDEYFDGLDRAGIRQLADLPGCAEILNRRYADEAVLYELMDVVFSHSRHPAPTFRPYHGFHLSSAEDSLWQLAFNDVRHSNTPNRWGRFGGNTYPREQLMQSMRELFFRDRTFWRLYANLSNAAIDRLVILAGMSPLDTIRRGGTAMARLGLWRARRIARRIRNGAML